MRIILLLPMLFLTIVSYSQTLSSVDSLLDKKMKLDKHASLAVGIVSAGEIVYLNTKGHLDVENNIKATINSSYHIASVSKTVTNLAIFKLMADGQINLDNDINDYLPFQITNPHSPSRVIRIRDLLNHRSCIVDDIEFYQPYWHASKGDSRLELNAFLKDYLTNNGRHYSRDHYVVCPDIGPFKYSNTGFALLGLIVEHVSSVSFEQYCQKNIFEPLDMNSTSWFLSNLDLTNIAKTYVSTDSTDLYFDGHNGYPDYPAGQLRTSIKDYASLIQGFLLAKEDSFIFNENIRNEILPLPQYAQLGFYTWFLNPMNNNLYYQHGGRDKGVRSRVIIDRNFNNAIIVFSNSNASLGSLIRDIEKLMFSR